MLSTGFITASTQRQRHVATPITRPSSTETGAATTITDRVSIAHFHCPISAIHTKVPPANSASRKPPSQ